MADEGQKFEGYSQVDTIALDDVFILVDKSDTTHSLQGTTKYCTAQQIANLVTVSQNPAVENSYLTIAAMLADQGNQTSGQIQYADDASADPTVASGYAFYTFNGTAGGSLSNYTKLSEEETFAITRGARTWLVSDIQEDTIHLTEVASSEVGLEYNDTSGYMSGLLLSIKFTNALEFIIADASSVDYYVKIYNQNFDKYFQAPVTSFTVVNTDYVRVNIGGTIPATDEIEVGHLLEISFDIEGAGGTTSDLQTAYATTLLFDQNRTSTFGDSTDNSHTQSGAIVLSYDFTGAVEGAVRTLQITSDGNTITIPTQQNKTGFINNNSDSLLSVSGNVITPENGKTYDFVFWHTNGYVNVIIIDAEYLVTDITPPTFSVSPASSNVVTTAFDITATLSENGTVYAVVVADGATAPTSTEVKAGTGSGGSGELATDSATDSGSGVTLNLTGLSSSTDYDVYVVGEDASGNLMASPTLVNVTTAASVSLPDISSYNITRFYGLQQTQQSVNLAPVRIGDGNGNSHELFFDTSGKISLSSKIGTGAVPSANDLQWYIDNEMVGSTIYVVTLYCHLTSHTFGSTTHFKLWDSTNGFAVDPENGQIAIQALGTGQLAGSTSISELNAGNDFSLTSITNNSVNSSATAIFTNESAPAPEYLTLNNDRRTNKRIGILQDDGSTAYFADALAQDDTANQKRLSITFDASGNMVSYKDAVSQATVSVSANSGYSNTIARLMSFNSGYFTGFFQLFAVHNAAISGTDVANLDSELSTYLGY